MLNLWGQNKSVHCTHYSPAVVQGPQLAPQPHDAVKACIISRVKGRKGEQDALKKHPPSDKNKGTEASRWHGVPIVHMFLEEKLR